MQEMTSFQKVVFESLRGEVVDVHTAELLKLLEDPDTLDAEGILTICLRSSERQRVRRIIGAVFHLYPKKTKDWFSALSLPFCPNNSCFGLPVPFYAALPLAFIERASLYCCGYHRYWPADFLNGVTDVLGEWFACSRESVYTDVWTSLPEDKKYEQEMKEVIAKAFAASLLPQKGKEGEGNDRRRKTKEFAGMLFWKAREARDMLPMAEKLMEEVCYALFRGVGFSGRLAIIGDFTNSVGIDT